MRHIALAWTLLTASVALANTPATVAPMNSVDDAQAMVEHLSSEEMAGRLPGTEGVAKARDYIVEQLKQLKLEPGLGDDYVQPFSYATSTKATEKRLRFGDRPLHPSKFNVLGLGSGGAFEAAAVFVGYSIVDEKRKYDSYAGVEKDALKGKVLVVYRYEPQDARGRSEWTGGRGWTRNSHLVNKVKHAARMGAAAIIIVNPPTQANAQLQPGTTLGRAVPVPVLMTDHERFKFMLKQAGRDDVTQLARQWQAKANAGPFITDIGLTLKGVIKLETIRTHAKNVIAKLPGAGKLAKQAIVIGAHFDHIGHGEYGSRARAMRGKVHFGADDNASGTVGMMMLAQRFAKYVADGNAPGDRRTLYFVGFNAEERGLIGSRHMVDNLDKLGLTAADIKGMLNLDMVGRMREGKLFVSGVDTGDVWRQVIDPLGKKHGVELSLAGSGFGPSDHANFYRAGIPAMHFFTGIHLDYHTPLDTPDKINAKGIVKTVDIIEDVAKFLWTDPVAVAYVAPKRGKNGALQTVGANRAFLGISPSYESAGGAKIDSVVPDAPASKAGLEAGDKIIGWDDKTIANFQDLSAALRDAQPGDKVKVTIERDDRKLAYEVELGER